MFGKFPVFKGRIIGRNKVVHIISLGISHQNVVTKRNISKKKASVSIQFNRIIQRRSLIHSVSV
ncbi:hypothetical protein ES705_46119 [subsurface metagenome]